MTNNQLEATIGGIAIGLAAAVTLFFTVPAYHDYIVWAWTTPWLYGLGATIGVALAIATD